MLEGKQRQKMLEKKTEIKNKRGKTEIENAGRENRDRKYQRRKQRQKILEEKTEIENQRETEIENAKFKIALQWIKGT